MMARYDIGVKKVMRTILLYFLLTASAFAGSHYDFRGNGPVPLPGGGWKSCAMRPLSLTIDDDWGALALWVRDPAVPKNVVNGFNGATYPPKIAKEFLSDPRLLVNHGICNERTHTIILCFPSDSPQGFCH